MAFQYRFKAMVFSTQQGIFITMLATEPYMPSTALDVSKASDVVRPSTVFSKLVDLPFLHNING